MELNKIYCMDNLELLKQLPNESISLIYCDILYNTGKKFKDYDDKLGTPQEAMEWYKPRLIEMKRVLKNTGTLLIQCDVNLVHYLKCFLDEVLIFKNDIIWCYNIQSRRTEISNKHDNILRYVKTNSYVYNTQYKPYTEKTLKEYRYTNEKGERCCRTCRRDKDGNKVVSDDIPDVDENIGTGDATIIVIIILLLTSLGVTVYFYRDKFFAKFKRK